MIFTKNDQKSRGFSIGLTRKTLEKFEIYREQLLNETIFQTSLQNYLFEEKVVTKKFWDNKGRKN